MTALRFEWAGWTFEPAEWRLTGPAGDAVALPNRTLDLLALLLDRAPGLVTKEEILSTVWKDTVVEEGNIAFHIASLRKTLDRPDEDSCIETVRGRGYRFAAPITRIDPTPPPVDARGPDPAPTEPPASSRQRGRLAVAVVLTALVAAVAWWNVVQRTAPIRSVAVLPVTVDDGVTLPGDGELAGLLADQITRRTTTTARVVAAEAPDEAPWVTASRLGLEAALTTRLFETATGIRVQVQLFAAADPAPRWHWIFEVPGQASTASGQIIAARLAAGLGQQQGIAKPVSATAVPEAQALTVEGRTLWRLRTPSDVQQAIRLYERAIALDPTYAPAYAGLADAYNLTMSGLTPSVRYPRAREAAERAVALDPDLAEGHTALAFLRYKFEWRWDDAEREFQRALALDPDYAQARHWYGEFLGLLGRFDESLAQLRRAIELEPDAYPIQSDMVPPLLLTGQTAEARAVVEAIATRSPNWHFIPYRLAEIYQAEGRDREAAEQHWRWMMLTGSSLQAVDRLRAAFNEGGRAAMTRVEIADLLAIESASPGAWLVATNLSRAYARIGDRASALRWLDLALDRREDAAISLLVHPDYDLIRSDPAFRERIRRVGLPLPPQ